MKDSEVHKGNNYTSGNYIIVYSADRVGTYIKIIS